MISIICQFCIAKIRFENIVALAIFLRKAKSRRFRRAPEAGNGDFLADKKSRFVRSCRGTMACRNDDTMNRLFPEMEKCRIAYTNAENRDACGLNLRNNALWQRHGWFRCCPMTKKWKICIDKLLKLR